MTHSKLPFKLSAPQNLMGLHNVYNIDDADNKRIIYAIGSLFKDDGEFIIKSCNNHQKLVEALKRLMCQCPCTIFERDSGHKEGCFIPETEALLESLQDSQEGE